jgi:Bacterial membrane protein YfhO
MPVFSRLKPFLFLTGLGLFYFGALLTHPTYVLYSDHSDLLATFLPVKRFLVRSWQETGEVPLWCPYSFGGMPLVHDVQVAAFYPFHFPLYLLPEEWLGAAMSWLVVAHVIIAGCCMYVYGQSRGLNGTAGVVAAVGYMFAGKWLLHVLDAGHYVMIPLAWLPLVVLWLERAMAQRSLLHATWAGATFALIVLGAHPQMTFFAGLFIVLWTAGSAREWAQSGAAEPSVSHSPTLSLSHFITWLRVGIWTAGVAAVLSAVQLLPALEAAPESTRAVGVAASDAAAVALPSLLGLLGPAWNGSWEDRGCLGFLWVAAAITAPLVVRGPARFEAGVGLVLVVFSAGGAVFLQWLPGFRFFQLPVRMLMFLALPIALLAGRSTQVLLTESPVFLAARECFRRVLFSVLCAGLILAGHAAATDDRAWQPAYWTVLLLAVTGALWLFREQCPLSPRAWAMAWFAILLADSWGLTWSRVAVRPVNELYAPSACVRYLAAAKERAPHERWRVLDRGLPGQPSSAPLGAALPMCADAELEPVLGYNPFDLRRYKEFLQFIMDEDGPIRPRHGIFGYPIVQGFPVRNKSLLDLLGTRYLLEPVDEALHFSAAGEPGINESWQSVGPEDPHPAVYSFLAGGMQQLPPYRIYGNLQAFPRAFLVRRAGQLADRPQVLAQLKSTDFRREVLLEGSWPEPDACLSAPTDAPDLAKISAYRPNRVAVTVHAACAGYLVLTDVWFPGWDCTVDGQPARIYRANYLFRAVAVPAGDHEVEFVFAPWTYRCGQRISIVGWIAVLAFSFLSRYRKKRCR